MSRLQLILLVLSLSCLIQGSLSQLQFPASYITIPRGDLKFYFDFDEARSIVRMGLEADKNLDYFAIGFAPDEHYGMDNFDIVAFVFPNNNAAPTVMDLYSFGFGRPPTDVSLGGTDDYNLIDSYVTDGKRQVLFERAFDTGDRFDHVLNPDVTRHGQVMNWAYIDSGAGTFSYHEEHAGTITSPLYNGLIGTATEYLPGGTPTKLFMAIHGWAMLIGWGLLVEIAIQIGRYRKHDKYIIATHIILNAILYITTIVAVILILVAKAGDISGTLPIVHLCVGVLMMILATSQIVVGWILRVHIVRPTETNKIRLFNRIHFTTGSVLYFASKFQIGLGLYLWRPSYMGWVWLYYIVVFALRIFQEYSYMIWNRLGGPKSLERVEGKDSKLPQHQKLMELLNYNTPIWQIQQEPELKDLKWAMLEDKVFETTGFNHPGGNYVLKYIQGREIGRFAYGGYPLELYPESGQHQHSTNQLRIIEKHLIGTIKNGHRILTFLGGNEEEVYVKREGGDTMGASLLSPDPLKPETARWTLCRKTELSSCISKFEFHSKGYSVNTETEDIRHLGRHMKVSHDSIRKTRTYTVVLSQSQSRIQRREKLWKNRNNSEAADSESPDHHAEAIPFLIKRYDIPHHQTFSSFVHNSAVNSQGFIVEGPFGPGLGLTPESTGTHIVFANGTGIWPFLDFFDYLLEDLLDPNRKRKLFNNGFKVHVFAGFRHIDDFVGLDMCEKLIQACKDGGLEDAFKLTVTGKGAKENQLYNVVNGKFDDAFIQQNVDPSCEVVWVCGSPEFNYKVPTTLESIGVQKDKIFLV